MPTAQPRFERLLRAHLEVDAVELQLVDRTGRHAHAHHHWALLARARQARDGLLPHFRRPGRANPGHICTAMLQIEAMAA
jgi:hypothetical protein